jgi:hypothetical protein
VRPALAAIVVLLASGCATRLEGPGPWTDLACEDYELRSPDGPATVVVRARRAGPGALGGRSPGESLQELVRVSSSLAAWFIPARPDVRTPSSYDELIVLLRAEEDDPTVELGLRAWVPRLDVVFDVAVDPIARAELVPPTSLADRGWAFTLDRAAVVRLDAEGGPVSVIIDGPILPENVFVTPTVVRPGSPLLLDLPGGRHRIEPAPGSPPTASARLFITAPRGARR